MQICVSSPALLHFRSHKFSGDNYQLLTSIQNYTLQSPLLFNRKTKGLKLEVNVEGTHFLMLQLNIVVNLILDVTLQNLLIISTFL